MKPSDDESNLISNLLALLFRQMGHGEDDGEDESHEKLTKSPRRLKNEPMGGGRGRKAISR